VSWSGLLHSFRIPASALFCGKGRRPADLAVEFFGFASDGIRVSKLLIPIQIRSGAPLSNHPLSPIEIMNTAMASRKLLDSSLVACAVLLATSALGVKCASGATLPVVRQGPSSQTIEDGSTAVLCVDADDDSSQSKGSESARPGAAEQPAADHAGGYVKYKWLRNGEPLVGASEAVLVIRGASTASSGLYRCVLSNSAGSVNTDEAELRVVEASCPGHLTMMSCRSFSGIGGKRLIAGFVVGRSSMRGSMPLVLRASGPSLLSRGVERALPDPLLVLREGGAFIAANRGWSGDMRVSSAAGAAGAMDWDDVMSSDSALVETLPCGAYTAEVFGDKGDTGFAAADVFDTRPPSQFTRDLARLVNVSVRSPVGLGANVPIMKFAVGGTTAVTLLIRGMGPALSAHGVAEVLATPSLLLYRLNVDGSQTWLQSNTRWGGKPYLSEIADRIGAFPWKSVSEADAAILLTVPPGEYVLILAGADGETGVAIMEIYEVP